MAANDFEMKYADFSAFGSGGSLAFDIDSFSAAPAFEPDYEPEYEPETKTPDVQEQPLPKTHVKKAKKHRHLLRVSPFTVFGFALVSVLLVLMLLSYVNLTKISDSSVELRNEITELEIEQTKLRVQYESVFDLNAIEEYATGTLGMVKADSSQISYLDAGSEDKAVIIEKEDDGGWMGEIKNFFNSIVESLR